MPELKSTAQHICILQLSITSALAIAKAACYWSTRLISVEHNAKIAWIRLAVRVNQCDHANPSGQASSYAHESVQQGCGPIDIL